MPTYSYICNDCKQKWNSFHSMEEKEERCSFCSSKLIERCFNFKSEYNILQTNEKEKIKNRVEKQIEEARNDLKERIKETRKDYKP